MGPTITATTDTPTESPTKNPTTDSPTVNDDTASPTKSLTTAPVAAGCYNTLNFGYKGDIEHSCEWVQRTDFRRNLLCTKMTDVREACPVSCGTCCEDNPDFKTDTPSGNRDVIGLAPIL